MDNTLHPKQIFADMRKAVDPLFADGFKITDTRLTPTPGHPSAEVVIALAKGDPNDPDAPEKSISKALAIYIPDKLHAEAVFNMLTDYAQSKSLNARK